MRTLGLRGSELLLFWALSIKRGLTIPQSRACVRRASQLPLHKGASGCSRTSAFPQSIHFLPQFDNPSVKNQRFLTAVHCDMTATGSHGNFDSLRGAAPFTQGSRGCSRTSTFIDVSQKNRKMYHILRLFAMTWFFDSLQKGEEKSSPF